MVTLWCGLNGPGDLVRMLQIERALSGVVAILVRMGLVDQTPDSVDQRQRMLRITRSG
jgi:DNA-binding MarR family transcriptional regulator